jgi:hypothetical protein
MNLKQAVDFATDHGIAVQDTIKAGAPFKVGRVTVYHTPGGKACWTFDGWGRKNRIGIAVYAAVEAQL